MTLVTGWLWTELRIQFGCCWSGCLSFEHVGFDYDFDIVIVAEFETFCILHFSQRESISYLLSLAVFGKIEICLRYWELFLFAHHYLQLTWLCEIFICDCIVFKCSLHHEFFSELRLSIFRLSGPCVNFFTATHPQQSKLASVRCLSKV